jgi:LysR family hydrogen peroxide-inducible transcriptional activator
MAIDAGILVGTDVDAKPLKSEHPYRRIALIWRRSSPRESEFQLLAVTLRRIAGDLIPDLTAIEPAAPALEPTCV